VGKNEEVQHWVESIKPDVGGNEWRWRVVKGRPERTREAIHVEDIKHFSRIAQGPVTGRSLVGESFTRKKGHYGQSLHERKGADRSGQGVVEKESVVKKRKMRDKGQGKTLLGTSIITEGGEIESIAAGERG